MDMKCAFDLAADKYDRNRRRVIPCFDDFYGCMLSLIPYGIADAIDFLDIGAGTGLVTEMVLNRFPRCRATLIDISEEMLLKAKERFAKRSNIRFEVFDYSRTALSGNYDLVLSAMSIHHLSNPDKQSTFKNIHNVLSSGGLFINAEIVRGDTEGSEQICRELWRQHIEKSGLTQAEIDEIYKRMEYDIPASLNKQLDWLREVGFEDVDCFYKYFSFAVYAGKKTI
jgi:tRNA (cmo5U34)-methyltransferase